jgi:hypothetical protein
MTKLLNIFESSVFMLTFGKKLLQIVWTLLPPPYPLSPLPLPSPLSPPPSSLLPSLLPPLTPPQMNQKYSSIMEYLVVKECYDSRLQKNRKGRSKGRREGREGEGEGKEEGKDMVVPSTMDLEGERFSEAWHGFLNLFEAHAETEVRLFFFLVPFFFRFFRQDLKLLKERKY